MESLVHPQENTYFGLSLIISLISVVVVVALGGLGILISLTITVVVLHGLSIGHMRANGIRVSKTQFPEVHRLAEHLASRMELVPAPTIYVIQAGGTLNAFATRFFGRNFVVIYSNVLELAYQKGEAALAFVICHELAHLKRKHLTRRWLTYPSLFIPFLGAAYSRACEYTCDRFGAHFRPDGARDGLLVLAAGTGLYRQINVQEFIRQTEEHGFWESYSEVTSSHPHLPNRIKALELDFTKDSLECFYCGKDVLQHLSSCPHCGHAFEEKS